MAKKPSTNKKKATPGSSDKAGLWQTPKGMRDLLGDDFYAFQGFMEKAAEVAVYYGFKPIETPMVEREEVFRRGVGESTDIVEKEMYAFKTKGGDRLVLRPEGTAAIMRAYLGHGLSTWPQPVMLYYFGPFFRHDQPQRGRYRQFQQFGLEILGHAKSINDATIINLTLAILAEAGIKEPRLLINSIGDNDCRPAWRRELINYYRKHVKDICADCRERLKTNPLRLLDCKNPDCQSVKAGAPESVAFLCAHCREHFKEVLEYLDTMGIRYELMPTLVRGLDYYSRTVFEITTAPTPVAEGETAVEPLSLASGGRYDYLARILGSKKDVPAVGVGIGVDRVIEAIAEYKLRPRVARTPKVFFIQLSFEAKLKSFEVIDVLRKAKVPIAHSLAKDSLGAQLATAEKLKIPYAVILGQKEALENTVIVRDMESRFQDTVKIKDLTEFLKKIRS